MQGISAKLDGKSFWTGKTCPVQPSPAPELTPSQVPIKKSSTQIGREGELVSNGMVEEQGHSVIAEHVKVSVNGKEVVVDNVSNVNDTYVLIETKANSGRFTTNQQIVYPQMRDPLPIISEGTNIAEELLLFLGGSDPVYNYQFIVIKVSIPIFK